MQKEHRINVFKGVKSGLLFIFFLAFSSQTFSAVNQPVENELSPNAVALEEVVVIGDGQTTPERIDRIGFSNRFRGCTVSADLEQMVMLSIRIRTYFTLESLILNKNKS